MRLLRLARIRSHWQSLASQAEAEGWTYSQFLYVLCEQEVEQRQQARQQRLLRAAQRPWSKALADYDHSGRIKAGPWQELEALSRQSEWLQRGENVLLYCFAEAQALRPQRCG
ncbi:MAG: ATP-binding protein, partial [Synechococcaceae cyanobacterium ELA182]